MLPKDILSSEEDLSYLNFFYDILLRRKWWGVLISVVVFTILLIYLFKRTPLYKAATLVRLGNQNIVSTLIEGSDARFESGQEYYRTQCLIMTSDTLKSLLLEKLLSENGTPDFQKIFKTKFFRISVSMVGATTIAKITVLYSDKKEVAKIANLIPACYADLIQQGKETSSKETLRWLFQEAKETRARITALYEAIEKTKQSAGVFLSENNEKGQTAMDIQREETVRKYIQSKLIRLQMENRCSAIRSFLKNNEDPSGLPPYLSSEILNELVKKLNDTRMQLVEAEQIYKSKHPNVVELQKKVTIVKQSIYSNLQLRQDEVCQEAAFARSEEETLSANLKNIENSLYDEKKKIFEIDKMEKEIASAQEIYDMLIKKSKQTELFDNNEFSNFSVIDKALPPEKPYLPNYPRDAALYLFLALALGFLSILGAEYIDTRILDRENAKFLQLPCLGEIPKLSAGIQGLFISFDSSTHIVNESFKTISTNLQLLANQQSHLKSLLFTSTLPNEGKTFVITNLARHIARGDKRVVLVDTDFYMGDLSKGFNLNNQPGISNILIDQINISSALKSTDMTNLKIIPCGNATFETSILQHLHNLTDFFVFLEKNFDFVFVDSPPSQVTADVRTISNLTQGTVYIVNAQKTNKWKARKNIAHLKEQKVSLLGTILNQVDFRHRPDVYYSEYYQNKKNFNETMEKIDVS